MKTFKPKFVDERADIVAMKDENGCFLDQGYGYDSDDDDFRVLVNADGTIEYDNSVTVEEVLEYLVVTLVAHKQFHDTMHGLNETRMIQLCSIRTPDV